MVPYSDDTVIPLRCGIQFVGIVCFIAFKLSTLKEIAPQSRGENVSAFALPSQRFRDKKKRNCCHALGWTLQNSRIHFHQETGAPATIDCVPLKVTIAKIISKKKNQIIDIIKGIIK